MNITLQGISKLKKNLDSPRLLRIPGDKSISHRSLILGAIAQGTTEISGLLEGEDVLSTWKCLKALGISITKSEDRIRVIGKGKNGLLPPSSELDCGNSGTTLRLLMGVLAGQAFSSRLIGDLSLSKRPMKRIAAPLESMGAEILLTHGNTAPILITGKSPLQAIQYDLPVASAQLKSALLLAGLYCNGITVLTGKLNSRDHTEKMLSYFGCKIGQESFGQSPTRLSISGDQNLSATSIQVPGDISSAAFWIGLALIVPDAVIEIENVLLNPTRTGILNVLKRMGAQIEIELTASSPEPVGTLTIRHSKLNSTEIHPEEVPSLIDELPLIAVLATFAEGTTQVRGAEELRIKETDRLEAIASNLQSMGARVELAPDGFSIQGPQALMGAKIHTFHDHRIAMAFSIAAMRAAGKTEILGCECVSISYPGFYETLNSLV